MADSLLGKNPILFSKLKNLPLEENDAPRELLIEVVKFMYLVSVSDIKLSPSLIVDLGWHEFILFTKVYQRFCTLELGSSSITSLMITGASNNRAYLKTIQYYINIFGEPPRHIWGEISHEEWSDSQCGSCKSN